MNHVNHERGTTAREKIIAHIEVSGSATYRELQDMLQCSQSTAYHHMAVLSAAGMVRNEPTHNPRGGEMSVWYLGENIDCLRDPEVKRRFTKVWPMHHVRDALVTALFGAPQLGQRL